MQFASKMQRYAAAREAFARRQQHQQQAYATRTAGSQQLQVNEHADKVELFIDVPGVKANDLNLTIDNRVLTITGSRATSESNSNVFSRKFALDTTAIDATNLSANLIDGVLTVTAPKTLVKPSSAAPIQVTITTNKAEDVQSTPTAMPDVADITTETGTASIESSTTAIEEDPAPSTYTETTTTTTEHEHDEPGALDDPKQGENNIVDDVAERTYSDDNNGNDNDDGDDDYVLMVETPDDESDVELENETVLKA